MFLVWIHVSWSILVFTVWGIVALRVIIPNCGFSLRNCGLLGQRFCRPVLRSVVSALWLLHGIHSNRIPNIYIYIYIGREALYNFDIYYLDSISNFYSEVDGGAGMYLAVVGIAPFALRHSLILFHVLVGKTSFPLKLDPTPVYNTTTYRCVDRRVKPMFV